MYSDKVCAQVEFAFKNCISSVKSTCEISRGFEGRSLFIKFTSTSKSSLCSCQA